MMNLHVKRVFVLLVALSLMLIGRSEAQMFTSPEPFAVYRSFPPINGNVIYRDSDAVTVTIMRNGQSWDGNGWTTPTFTQAKRQLATTVVGNRWSYGGALPKEDGVYKISVMIHSGNKGSGSGIQIRVESGKNPSLTSTVPTDATGAFLPTTSFIIPDFQPVIKIGVGELVRNVAVADFNGDKKPDLVVGSGYNRISILRGDGAGGFATAGIFPVEKPPSAVAAGDFNGDAKADVAVVHSNSNSVSIFLGDGRGQLGAATGFGVGEGPLWVVASDFNRDGKLDLATANYGANVKPNTVSILHGDGKGRFRAAQKVVVGNGPGFIIVRDFNGDGKPDMAVSNHHLNSVSILLGTESGFTRSLDVATGESPRHIAAGDFNADGHVDLATSNGHRWSDRQHTMSILLGNGRGGFQSKTHVVPGVQPQSIGAADFNGDGKTDLCVADAPLDRLVILLGNGKGKFSAPVVLPVGTNPVFLAVADFDADTKPDIVAAIVKGVAVLLKGSPGKNLPQKKPLQTQQLKKVLPETGGRAASKAIEGDLNKPGPEIQNPDQPAQEQSSQNQPADVESSTQTRSGIILGGITAERTFALATIACLLLLLGRIYSTTHGGPRRGGKLPR